MKRNSLTISLVIAISIAIYANSLQNGFVMDDWGYIVYSKFIKDWHNIFTFFTTDYQNLSMMEIDLQRPLMTLSVMLDYQAWGLNPKGYHLTNLVIHILNAVTIFYILSTIFFNNAFTPVAVALLFAVHPIHTETVNAISFREDILFTFFYLLSILFFLKGIRSSKKIILTASLMAYILSLLSKETALTLPIMIFLIHLAVGGKSCDIFRRKWFYLGLIAITLIYLFSIYILTNPLGQTFLEQGGRARYSINIPTIGGILFYYMQLLIFPTSLSIEHDFTRYHSLFEPATMMIWASIMSIIFLGIHKLIKKPVLGLFILWFFITLVPTSNIIPIYDVMSERYLYLPSIGPIVLFSIFLNDLRHVEYGRYRFCILISAILISSAYSILTFNRNEAWVSDYTLWKDAVKKDNKNPWSHRSLAMVAYARENLDEALSELRMAEQLNPNSTALADIYYNMGLIFEEKNLNDKAIEYYNRSLSLKPYNADVHYAVGILYEKEKRLIDAVFAFKKVLDIDPQRTDARREIELINKLQRSKKQR